MLHPLLPSRRGAAAVLLLAGTLAAAACAPAVERVYVAPSRHTVFAGSDASMDGEGVSLWVENRSTVPVTVTSIQLSDCENIKNRCEVTRTNLTVRAGQRLRVATIRRDNQNRGYSYRWSYTWSHDGVEIPGIPR
jgi:hypothetical protein